MRSPGLVPGLSFWGREKINCDAHPAKAVAGSFRIGGDLTIARTGHSGKLTVRLISLAISP